jgi:hypothetical protein
MSSIDRVGQGDVRSHGAQREVVHQRLAERFEQRAEAMRAKAIAARDGVAEGESATGGQVDRYEARADHWERLARQFGWVAPDPDTDPVDGADGSLQQVDGSVQQADGSVQAIDGSSDPVLDGTAGTTDANGTTTGSNGAADSTATGWLDVLA